MSQICNNACRYEQYMLQKWVRYATACARYSTKCVIYATTSTRLYTSQAGTVFHFNLLKPIILLCEWLSNLEFTWWETNILCFYQELITVKVFSVAFHKKRESNPGTQAVGPDTLPPSMEEGFIQKTKQMSSLQFGGEEFIQCLAALTVLPRTILKNWTNSSFCFKSSWCNFSSYSKTVGAGSKQCNSGLN